MNQISVNRQYLILRCLGLLLFLLHNPAVVAQQPPLRFALPVEGELHRDVFIINHVDHDQRSEDLSDYMCGRQTYDGHRGTDFAIRSFRSMDSGVHILAAASGRVVTVVETEYDRNKSVDRSLGFGNYVAVEHPEGYVTYYAHIRRGSSLVRVGDLVSVGQRLALVGSSGTSEDPHLHFEVWRVLDPFEGSCSPDRSHWLDQPEYQTNYRLIDADVTVWPPELDTLRERPPHAGVVALSDTAVTFWSLQQHVQAADRLGVRWLTPSGDVWFVFESDAGIVSTYYYWWSWIRRPTIPGEWTVEYRVNNALAASRSFRIEGTSVIANNADTAGISVQRYGDVIRCNVPRECSLRIYDVLGRMLEAYQLHAGVNAIVLQTTPLAIVEIVADGQVWAKVLVQR